MPQSVRAEALNSAISKHKVEKQGPPWPLSQHLHWRHSSLGIREMIHLVNKNTVKDRLPNLRVHAVSTPYIQTLRKSQELLSWCPGKVFLSFMKQRSVKYLLCTAQRSRGRRHSGEKTDSSEAHGWEDTARPHRAFCLQGKGFVNNQL